MGGVGEKRRKREERRECTSEVRHRNSAINRSLAIVVFRCPHILDGGSAAFYAINGFNWVLVCRPRSRTNIYQQKMS